MNAEVRHTAVMHLPHVSMNLDPIHASVKVATLEMDWTAVESQYPALISKRTSAASAETVWLIQMAREVWHHSRRTVTWLTNRVLAWQLSVTTVRAELLWMDMKTEAVTYVTFITQEQVCLSWRVWPESLRTVNSLSSTSVITPVCGLTVPTDGGCHVILRRWRTGEGHHPVVVSAHAVWLTPAVPVTVTGMTKYGERTAVFWLTRQSFQWSSSGLEIPAIANMARRATTLWEN